jgi:putative adenylate-forming enzyme
MGEKLSILINFIKYRWFSRFGDLDALRKHQRKLYERQMAFVRVNSQFYKGSADLPIMDKESFMECFDDINTVGIDKNQAMDFALECERTRDFSRKLNGVTVGLSSGTSGHRGIFLVSDKERALWAGAMLAKALPKRHLLGQRIAFFMRADSELYETVKSRFIKFRFFDMLHDIDENIREMQALRPTILVAPPSCLLQMAQRNNARQIKPVKVISIAEVLEQADAENIKKAFGVDMVHQVYQCTEGFLAATCEHGVLHINEDIVQVEKERLDERRFVPIVTDLRRRAQPIIRYRLNDILVEKESPCSCGSVCLALEKIEGRQDDIFEFEGEKGTVAVFPDFIRRCMLFAEEVAEYRVQQISGSQVAVLSDSLGEESKRQIIDEFERLSASFSFKTPEIVFRPYEYDIGRKLKRVERLC